MRSRVVVSGSRFHIRGFASIILLIHEIGHTVQRQLRSAFSTVALLTACLAPPALTRVEREALLRAMRENTRVEVRSDQHDRQSFEAFAFMVLGMDYEWKIVAATLSVPITRRR